MYRTLPSQVFSIFFNCKRPQKSDHHQQCSEADFLIMEEGYALYWQSSNPSKQRYPRQRYIYTTAEHGKKQPLEVILNSKHLLQNRKNKLTVFKEIEQHRNYYYKRQKQV